MYPTPNEQIRYQDAPVLNLSTRLPLIKLLVPYRVAHQTSGGIIQPQTHSYTLSVLIVSGSH